MKIRLADNIRQLRKARSMTQEQLAEALGVTVGAVHKWETGQSMPEIKLLVEIAEFFETSVDAILGYGWDKGSMGEALYDMISVIQQNVFIFNASIRDNITMFSDFPREAVDTAIEMSGLSELIGGGVARTISAVKTAPDCRAARSSAFPSQGAC